MTDQSHPYVVRGVTKNGTVTYNCPTPAWAVRKHRDMIESKLTGYHHTRGRMRKP